jgi:hypothetical protein
MLTTQVKSYGFLSFGPFNIIFTELHGQLAAAVAMISYGVITYHDRDTLQILKW